MADELNMRGHLFFFPEIWAGGYRLFIYGFVAVRGKKQLAKCRIL